MVGVFALLTRGKATGAGWRTVMGEGPIADLKLFPCGALAGALVNVSHRNVFNPPRYLKVACVLRH